MVCNLPCKNFPGTFILNEEVELRTKVNYLASSECTTQNHFLQNYLSREGSWICKVTFFFLSSTEKVLILSFYVGGEVWGGVLPPHGRNIFCIMSQFASEPARTHSVSPLRPCCHSTPPLLCIKAEVLKQSRQAIYFMRLQIILSSCKAPI